MGQNDQERFWLTRWSVAHEPAKELEVLSDLLGADLGIVSLITQGLMVERADRPG